MDALRDLAARLGLYTTRGAGAGQLGNITALLQGVAWAYRRDGPRTITVLAALFEEKPLTEE
jgi:hypothetical protein